MSTPRLFQQTEQKESRTLIQPDNLINLPPEIWAEVFRHLDPVFLHSVFYTNKSFFYLALACAGFADYLEAVRSFPSPQIRLFVSLVAINDMEALRDLAIDPDSLFERNADAKMALDWIADEDQKMRDAVFANVERWFVERAKNKTHSKHFFSSLFFNHDNSMHFNFKTPKNYYLTHFAVALNQGHLLRTRQHNLFSSLDVFKPKLFEFACQFRHLDVIRFFMAVMDPLKSEVTSPIFPNLLWIACQYKNVEVFDLLISTYIGRLSEGDIRQAAGWAARYNFIEALNKLLERVQEAHQLNTEDGKTILHVACRAGQLDAAGIILDRFPTLIEVGFEECVVRAAKANCPPLINFLLSDQDNIPQFLNNHPQILFSAASAGAIDALCCLLDLGADPNVRGIHGLMALYFAARKKHVEVAVALLERGAAVDARFDGSTALHVACYENDLEIVNVLLEHGADQTLTNAEQLTPLQIGRVRGFDAIVDRLIAAQIEAQRGKKRGRDDDEDEKLASGKRSRLAK